MIKAASISYAVFMAALTALFCYGLVLVFSLNTNLEDHYQAQTDLVQDRFSALAYARAEFKELEPGEWLEGPGLRAGITHRFKKQPWGLFWNLSVQSIRQSDSVKQNFLVAPQMEQNDPTLYLRDNDEPLKLSGKTEIEGLIKCSSRSIKRLRINSDTKMEIVQNGPVERADKFLPKIELPELQIDLSDVEELYDSTELDLIIGFDQAVTVYSAGSRLENIKLKGHILVESTDTLTVAATAELQDVIVRAPKVIVEKGFEGTVQIIAEREIELGDEVVLHYPSALVVKTQGASNSAILVGEECKVSGAIVLDKMGANGSQEHIIQIGLDSEVTGQIYCGGVLELYGDVNGQVVSSQLLYQTNTTKYTNLLKDVSLTKPEHPEWLFGLDWKSDYKPPVILKKV